MPYVRCQQKVREGPEEVTTNRIKELRTQAGLTLEELAALIPGASKQLIHRLESGKTKLTVEWMRKIAPKLSVQIADLLKEGTGMPSGRAQLLADGMKYARAVWMTDGLEGKARAADEVIEMLENDATTIEVIECCLDDG